MTLLNPFQAGSALDHRLQFVSPSPPAPVVQHFRTLEEMPGRPAESFAVPQHTIPKLIDDPPNGFEHAALPTALIVALHCSILPRQHDRQAVVAVVIRPAHDFQPKRTTTLRVIVLFDVEERDSACRFLGSHKLAETIQEVAKP